MSAVVGFSFPEEAILVSDSRISFINGKVIIKKHDDLRKIFELTPQLAIGFTSDDVRMTHKIVKKLKEYIRDKAKTTAVYHLLHKLPKVADYEYKKLCVSMQSQPPMEFMYAGILSDRAIQVPERVIMDLIIQGGGGAIPEPIGRAMMTMKGGMMTINPPTPVIMRQRLPDGDISNFGIYTVGAIGSGASIEELFQKEYTKLLVSEPAPIIGFRSSLIRLHCDDFIKTSNIPTVGGAVQVLSINAKGVHGVRSSFKKIFSDSTIKDISSMEFDGEKWTYKNYENGTTEIIKSFFPSTNIEDS